jgi:beta-glucanase (GH16 family)
MKISVVSRWLSPIKWLAPLIIIAAVLPITGSAQTNLLANSGFESGNLNGWTTFGANNYVLSGGYAHSGTYYYKVYGNFTGSQNYTGIYQDIPAAPDDTYSADGWGYSLSSDAINGNDQVWIEVSFRDSSYNTLALYRSGVVTGANIASFGGLSTWFDLQITNQCSYTNASALIVLPGTITNTVTSLVAPPGTAYVRYQAVFAQGTDNANGSMYFDDLALNQTSGTVPPAPQWNIVWDDEFNGILIDRTKWTFETGNNNGWGNNELEYYTSNPQNAYVSDGLLHIVALEQSIDGYSFTSARMKTEGLYNTPVYGRFEWRAKLPAGVGMWPALWLLGSNFSSVGWPACGEIDVVENNGAQIGWVQGSLHYNSGNPTAMYYFLSPDSVTNWHTYDLTWSPGSIQWSVDGTVYETQSVGAPFNAPFFFIMNLAVGGNYVGNPSVAQIEAGTTFPAEMLVDYVRVYEQTAPLAISVATQPNGSFTLSWPTNIVCHLQAQTNSLSGTWSDVTGAANPFVVNPTPGQNAVFYRLESP